MSYCQTKDGQIFYQTFGDKSNPALIFSNSLGTDHTMWQPQIDALQDNFFIIAYDTRGHGKSDAPKGSYTIEELGEDVIALLNELSLQKANFCGISMGGLTGLWLAIFCPHYFDKIIVSNTAAKIGQTKAWQDRATQVRQEGLAHLAKSAPTRWFSDEFITKNPNVVNALTTLLANQNPEGYASCCDALSTADLQSSLSQAGVPILSIAGLKDPVTPPSDAQFIADTAPNARLVSIDASHIANIEQAEAFTQHIRQFLVS